MIMYLKVEQNMSRRKVNNSKNSSQEKILMSLVFFDKILCQNIHYVKNWNAIYIYFIYQGFFYTSINKKIL